MKSEILKIKEVFKVEPFRIFATYSRVFRCDACKKIFEKEADVIKHNCNNKERGGE